MRIHAIGIAAAVALLAQQGTGLAQSKDPETKQSVYTNLNTKFCKTLESDTSEAGYYLGRCTGTAGYTLLLEEGDIRQNITVVTPRKKKHSLDLWTVVSPAFSSVGPRAEWRINKQGKISTPTALIVRYNASEDSEHPDKTTSYLVVIKITENEICVTDRISPGPKANGDARRLADESATKPCLKAQLNATETRKPIIVTAYALQCRPAQRIF